jgi:methylmalonyl-CoA mutase cobalamin-binding subunit
VALGNELELDASQEQRIGAWKAVEEAARAVKAEDPNYAVIAVLAGAGKDKLRELDQYCPSLDAVGINTYAGIMSLPETIRS